MRRFDPPEFVSVRCPRCEQITTTTVGVTRPNLHRMMPVLKVITTWCPYCGKSSKVGEDEILRPLATAS